MAVLLHRPALGLLKSLARDAASSDTAPAVALADRLMCALPKMLAEHDAIIGALEALGDAARVEERHDVLDSAEGLILHAQIEENVLYPAAILVGDYLKEALGRWN